MAEWMVQIGRFDICFAVTSLNHLLVNSLEEHIKRLVKIFGYLKYANGRWKIIVILLKDIREISGKDVNKANLLEKYPDAIEDIYEGPPELLWRPLSTTVYFDSDHAHDKVMRQ